MRQLEPGVRITALYLAFYMTKAALVILALSLSLTLRASAGLEIAVSGGDWEMGDLTPGATVSTTGDKWQVTGSSDGREDIIIKADGVNWHPGSSPAQDTFVLRHDVSGDWGDPITSSGIILQQGLPVGATQGVDLQFQAPLSGHEGVAQDITATFIARNWAEPWSQADCEAEGGYWAATYMDPPNDYGCWFFGAQAANCDDTCASEGLTCDPGVWYDGGCTVLRHWISSCHGSCCGRRSGTIGVEPFIDVAFHTPHHGIGGPDNPQSCSASDSRGRRACVCKQ